MLGFDVTFPIEKPSLFRGHSLVIGECRDNWMITFLGLVVSNIFYFHPYLGKIPILTNMFQMG